MVWGNLISILEHKSSHTEFVTYQYNKCHISHSDENIHNTNILLFSLYFDYRVCSNVCVFVILCCVLTIMSYNRIKYYGKNIIFKMIQAMAEYP